MKLTQILRHTIAQQYAVGAYSPRYTCMIKPVLASAQQSIAPAIIQVSQKELEIYGITLKEFADEYFNQLKQLYITVPTTLHFNHGENLDIIKEAIEAGFESVMIDASDKEFDENVEITAEVVEYAHENSVCVEAQLGRVASNDLVETEPNYELYTDPEEAKDFVEKTGIDALSISVGTVKGFYTDREPHIDLEIIKGIRELTNVYLTLQGGSGIPEEMLSEAIYLEGGGISKVNFGSDLEQSFLWLMGRSKRLENIACGEIEEDMLRIGSLAVNKAVNQKIHNFLKCNGKGFIINSGL